MWMIHSIIIRCEEYDPDAGNIDMPLKVCPRLATRSLTWLTLPNAAGKTPTAGRRQMLYEMVLP